MKAVGALDDIVFETCICQYVGLERFRPPYPRDYSVLGFIEGTPSLQTVRYFVHIVHILSMVDTLVGKYRDFSGSSERGDSKSPETPFTPQRVQKVGERKVGYRKEAPI